jgi:hypothetical protein
MKKYLLSLIFIVTPLLASAQESLYESLVNEEKNLDDVVCRQHLSHVLLASNI